MLSQLTQWTHQWCLILGLVPPHIASIYATNRAPIFRRSFHGKIFIFLIMKLWCNTALNHLERHTKTLRWKVAWPVAQPTQELWGLVSRLIYLCKLIFIIEKRYEFVGIGLNVRIWFASVVFLDPRATCRKHRLLWNQSWQIFTQYDALLSWYMIRFDLLLCR